MTADVPAATAGAAPAHATRVDPAKRALDRTAQQALERGQTADDDADAALDEAPHREADGVGPLLADDLGEADDGDGDDGEADAEDAGEADLLFAVDLQGRQEAEGEQHDEDV